MTSRLVFEPYLREILCEEESRSHAFIAKNYGAVSRSSSVTVRMLGEGTGARSLLLEVLVGLLVRMEPLVTAVSVEADPATLAALESAVTARYPVRVKQTFIETNLSMGIGGSSAPFVDASGWEFGCNVVLPQNGSSNPAGAFLGALDAAKYLFATAVAFGCERAPFDVSWTQGVFDSWTWKWGSSSSSSGPTSLPALDAIIAGCGGVAAGYLWLASMLPTPGNLALIDDDTIEVHNLNRLFFASLADARAMLFKVEVAASMMTAFGWKAEPIRRTVEHPSAMKLLASAARRGAVLISAVGEPMTRRFLQNREFANLIDGATNNDGSIRVIGVHPESACLHCYLAAETVPRAPAPAGCGQVNTRSFAGVVPHLSAGAGFLACVEHLKLLLGAPLKGVNVQPITRRTSEVGRELVPRSAACPRHV